MTMTAQASRTQHLARPGGRIAYEVHGEGPLVVAVPGMGDTRAVYRFLVPRLVEAGYRVATMDLRGHGDSDTTFDSYDDLAAGSDVLALIEHLGGPAVVIGGSMGAAAAVWAAAERPDAVAGLVLAGPFVRDVPISWAQRAALRLALRRPWGPALWAAYYAKLYPLAPPPDLAEHRARIRTSMARPGGWQAFLATTRTSHAPVEPRLAEVSAPTLVLMGSADPDFPDAAAEARLVGERLDAEVLVLDGVGHYPHAEQPDVVARAVIALLGKAFARG